VKQGAFAVHNRAHTAGLLVASLRGVTDASGEVAPAKRTF